MDTLHYIYDPLCGWCYGAAPLLAALQTRGLPIRLHAGGMMTGTRRQAVTPELRSYVLGHDERIARLTGQEFGTAYRDGLLNDTSAVFDSEPPITAILAAEALGGHGLAYLKALQIAHYRNGRKISEVAVLQAIAGELSLDQAAFTASFAELSGAATAAHIAESRKLLAQLGGQGFPTLALETKDGWQVLDVGAGLADPQGFVERLAPQNESAGAFCTPDGCQ